MRQARAFTFFLVLSSLGVTLHLLQVTDLNIGLRALVGLTVFLVIGFLSESQPLVLPGAQGHVTSSGLTFFAALAIFPPLHAAAAGAFSVLTSELLFKKKPLIKASFNTAQCYLSIIGAAFVFRYMEKTSLDAMIPYHIVALTLAILSYFLVNTALVSFLLSRLNSTSFWDFWSANFQWELIYVIGSVPMSLLLIVSYDALWIAGPFLLVAPLMLLKESYAQYIRLKTTYTETVRTLIKVIETHDTYTAGHSLRVAEYAKRLAVAARLSAKEIEKVEIAAYLHDLGKVDLAITHLVRKPGKLTPDEKRRVQLHPLVSADIAAQVTYFRGEIERIIRHHHEHYNGTGYPHGLRGSEIPLGSRIILIADAFDAMTSNRMYRSALDFERVRAEFIKYSGIQFDPELVPVFLEHCAVDPSTVIPQVEIPYEELLSTRLQVVASS